MAAVSTPGNNELDAIVASRALSHLFTSVGRRSGARRTTKCLFVIYTNSEGFSSRYCFTDNAAHTYNNNIVFREIVSGG